MVDDIFFRQKLSPAFVFQKAKSIEFRQGLTLTRRITKTKHELAKLLITRLNRMIFIPGIG
jgi:hypothetical protein